MEAQPQLQTVALGGRVLAIGRPLPMMAAGRAPASFQEFRDGLR